MQESPLFTKTYDTLKWVSNHTSRFPKSERFRLAKRIEDHLYEFYELIIHAALVPNECTETLTNADERLFRLKTYFRLARDRGFTSQKQYQYITGQFVEIGKLLGAWIKKVKR